MANSGSSSALPTDYQLGEYKINFVLGIGGFGITYLAMDVKLSSLVAIKEYFPQSFAFRDRQSTIIPSNGAAAENYRWGLEQFLKEARALAKFKHNNIVRVLRFFEANGTAYMVMEYEQGESMESYLRKRGGFLDEKSLSSIFIPVLSGLQAVHKAGLLHLDIKPDNIYLKADGAPMLIDFGSASQIAQDGEEKKLVALTPAYTAIENYPDKGEQGPWSDIYSMGATLYRCITGEQPVNTIDRFEKVGRGYPDPLVLATKLERPIYSQYIRECVDWAMKLDPTKRPNSASALQNGLMGKGMNNEEEKGYETNLLRSGYIGIASFDDSLKEEKRSIWTKLLMSLILMSILFIFLVKTGSITPQQVDDIVSSVVTKIYAVYEPIEDKFARTFRLRRDRVTVPQTAGTRPQEVARPVQQIKRVQGFNPAKQVSNTLAGHVDQVQSLAFMQNGAILASASADGIIKLWKTETGELIKTLHSQQNRAGNISASPDGSLLATISTNNTISVWDAATNTEVAKLVGHSDNVNQIIISPDQTRLASISDDKTVIVWSIDQKSIVYQFRFSAKLTAVAFSPNGKWLATGDETGEIKYWALSNGTELAKFRANDKKITSLVYSPNGKWLASGGVDNFLKLWSVGITDDDRTMRNAPDSVRHMVFSPDNNWLVVIDPGQNIAMWNINTGELVHQLLTEGSGIQAFALSADGTLLASAEGTKVKIWATP
ncbi:MAG: hypothetical protein BMS9Abin33_0621 [Gammaproteobacteria bacterium]|nr:MAG: hypothetical protein BMS9Abin33_0621 [Gammaproteobacteria bacterium]